MADAFICVELVGRSDCPRDRMLGRDGRFLETGGSMAKVARFASADAGKLAGFAAPNRRPDGLISSWEYR